MSSAMLLMVAKKHPQNHLFMKGQETQCVSTSASAWHTIGRYPEKPGDGPWATPGSLPGGAACYVPGQALLLNGLSRTKGFRGVHCSVRKPGHPPSHKGDVGSPRIMGRRGALERVQSK